MRWNRWASVTTVGLLAGTLAGCGDDPVGSGALKTSGIYADFKATADGSETTVDAQLFVENRDGAPVRLEAGDSLRVGINGETPRVLRPDFDKYLQTFDVSDGGTEVTIDFDRRNSGDKDAPESSVTLPEEFTMSLEVSGKVQRDQDVVITWEPSGISDAMYWLVKGECIWDADDSTADDGELTLRGGEDIEPHELDKDEACTVIVTLERHFRGKIDPAFRDGRFLGIQARTKTFTSVPVPEAPDDEGTGGSSGTPETGGSGNTETGGSGTETGGSANEAGAPGAAGSPAATGGTGTGGEPEGDAGAAGAATGGSSTGGSTQAAAGTAGASAGSAGVSEAAAGSPGSSGQGGAGGQD